MGALDFILNQSKKKLDRAGIKQTPLEVEQVILVTKLKTIELSSPTVVKVDVPNQGTFYQIYYGIEKEVVKGEI